MLCFALRCCCCSPTDHSVFRAVELQQLEALDFLLKRGRHDPDERCGRQRPLELCLKLASMPGDVGCQMARKLLEHGACPNAKIADDPSGCAPLHVATRRGVTDLVRVLLEHGAAADIRDDANCTPLHLACALPCPEGRIPDVVGLLLGAGADPESLDTVGRAPRDYTKSSALQETLLRQANWLRRRVVVLARMRGRIDGLPARLPQTAFYSVIRFL